MHRNSNAVPVGPVIIGGGHAPVIQTMTNTETTDIASTSQQIIDVWEHGAEIVRLAVPLMRAAKALPSIREAITAPDRYIPLVADIHFSPDIAYAALPHVDKIRINPGNLFEPARSRKTTIGVDSKRTAMALRDLLFQVKQSGKTVRIGVNQGSLSRRIVDEYGDGIEGLVQSAVEYVRTAREIDFLRLIISLKSSDPWMVVESHRQLAELVPEYPFHIGVTEAGWGLQGRARSAAGIGILLRDGLADTIRVSLAENPLRELPVARALVTGSRPLLGSVEFPVRTGVRGVQTLVRKDVPPDFTGRVRVRDAGDERVLNLRDGVVLDVLSLHTLDDTVQTGSIDADILRMRDVVHCPGDLATLIQTRLINPGVNSRIQAVQLPLPENHGGGHVELGRMLQSLNRDIIWEYRAHDENERMCALTDLAELYENGYLSWLDIQTHDDPFETQRDGFDILQGLGTGQWCAELIACPQCGRSSIDVSELIGDVRASFGHLHGIKLAVMGCIVNGPGEMEGADFGIVGSGRGTVALYVHGEVVARGVPVLEVINKLGDIIDRDPNSPR